MFRRLLNKFLYNLFLLIDCYQLNRWSVDLINFENTNKNYYIKLYKKIKNNKYPVIDEYENNTGYKINKNWLDNLAFKTQITKKNSPLCYQHGRVLYSSLCSYINKNKIDEIFIIETGTARAFSSLCMAKALEDLGKSGKIITIDKLPHNKSIYWNCYETVTENKTRKQIISKWKKLADKYIIFIQSDSKSILKKIFVPRVNFAFLDACHSSEEIEIEAQYVATYQKKGDMLVFDDYSMLLFPDLKKSIDLFCINYKYSMQEIKINEYRSYLLAIKK